MSLVNEINGSSYSEQNLGYDRVYGPFIHIRSEESLGSQLTGKPVFKKDHFCYMSLVASKRPLILQMKAAYWGKNWLSFLKTHLLK